MGSLTFNTDVLVAVGLRSMAVITKPPNVGLTLSSERKGLRIKQSLSVRGAALPLVHIQERKTARTGLKSNGDRAMIAG